MADPSPIDANASISGDATPATASDRPHVHPADAAIERAEEAFVHLRRTIDTLRATQRRVVQDQYQRRGLPSMRARINAQTGEARRAIASGTGRYRDLAPLIEVRWIAPLVRTLLGLPAIDADLRASTIDTLRFIMRWLDEPDLDLSQVPDDIRLAAMLKIAGIHIAMLNDERPLDADAAVAGADLTARSLVRDNVSAMLDDALR